jgi:uncharacterized membrane protein YidH (DUF202 family)
MNRSHLLSLAYLAFGVVYFGIGIVDVQANEILISSPTTNLTTLLLLVGSVVMITVAVGTFIYPEWFNRQTPSRLHLLIIWGGVLLGAAGFILTLAPVVL